ncbi:lytic transglycosylase activity protein [Lysinibacillus phage vB_LfM_LysYB1]|nr:lytic transglycosylase activity protein [Lysinibacillus phage vB_LfM_LysYB1]WAB25243.1 lytic transglycosylase activity protein [Lysinibacillus phage vB_LfM_LysYB2]
MRFITHVISYEETIQSIAQEYFGTTEKWTELAVLNNLDYPFIDTQGTEPLNNIRVKRLGEQLLIPVNDATVLNNVSSLKEADDVYSKSLGEDIELFSDFTAIPVTKIGTGEFISDVHGDLKTVQGLNNLRQSILIRLSTPRGSLLHHPEFGTDLHKYLGAKGTPGGVQKILVELKRTILTDPRVAEVVIEEATLDGDKLLVNGYYVPLDINEVIPLNFIL